MTGRGLLFAFLGIITGLLLARVVPDVGWVTVLVVAVLGASWLYLRYGRSAR